MEFVNPNTEIKVKLCPSCYKEQPISEFEKTERGRVRVCKLCRTCRNRQAREKYKKDGGRPDRVNNLLQLRDIVMDVELLKTCIDLSTEYGVALQIKQPISMTKDLEDYVRIQICSRSSKVGETLIKLAKVKEGKFIFNLYSLDGKYIRSKALSTEQLVAYFKLSDYAQNVIGRL